MTVLDRIVELLGPPQRRHDPGGWELVEQRVGAVLPDDYKQFMDAYGGGILCDWLNLGHPLSMQMNLMEITEIADWFVSWLSSLDGESDRIPYPIAPEPGGLFYWGNSSTGDECFLVPPSPGGRWHVGIWYREGEWHESTLGFAEWLRDELEGREGPANLLKFGPPNSVGYEAMD
jgi:hypothetical protein